MERLQLPFLAPAADTEALRLAAAGRASGRELVLFVSDVKRLNYAASFMSNLGRAGLSHHLMLGAERAACERMAEARPAETACLWHDPSEWVAGRDTELYRARAKMFHLDPTFQMWMYRWLVMSRLGAMGFNVLMMDTDVVVLGNVYAHFHALPLRPYALLFATEGWTDTNLQCGVAYLRGAAAPYGAAVRALASFPERFLRVIEHDYPPAHWIHSARNMTFFWDDQNQMRDTIFSAILGADVYRDTYCAYAMAVHEDMRKADACRIKYNAHIREAMGFGRGLGNGHPQWDNRWNVATPETPLAWRTRFGIQRSYEQVVWMPLAGDRGERQNARFAPIPEELGGALLPPEGARGELSRGLQRVLCADAQWGEAMWLARAAVGGDMAAAAAVHTVGPLDPAASGEERVALLPVWLANHWTRGRSGLYGAQLPRALLAHVTNAADKILTLKALDYWDHAAAAQLLPEGAFFRRVFADPATPPTWLKVVAFAPGGVTALPTRQALMESVYLPLALVSLLSGRAPTFPTVPCESGWISGKQKAVAPYQFPHCRTGVCNDFRVMVIGSVSAEERSEEAQQLSQISATVGHEAGSFIDPGRVYHRAVPEGMTCVPFVQTIPETEAERLAWGKYCAAQATPNYGKAFHAADLEHFVRLVGVHAKPHSTNLLALGGQSQLIEDGTVSEATRSADLPAAAAAADAGLAARVSFAELKAALKSASAEQVAYLRQPLALSGVPADLLRKARGFCSFDLEGKQYGSSQANGNT